jgi:exodeoxyribonuclease-3
VIIASWNVNGLRAVLKKGFEEWIFENSPEIVGLQEIKAQHQDVEGLIENIESKYWVYLNPAIKKGYSGTALLISKNLSEDEFKIHYGLGEKKFDSEGRIIWVELENLVIINGYFPNGQRDHSRVDFKLDFSKKVFLMGLEIQKKLKKEVIILGDINTAHNEMDLANPKSNINTTGFLPKERALIDEIIELGFTDLFRHFHPKLVSHYTWWTYRGDCRERNIGWRLDYFFSTKGIVEKVKSVTHQTKILGSDHCPILLEIKNDD